jgi:cell division protein FtsN
MAKSSSRNRGRSGGSSIFTGVLIGLVVGSVLAVGVALWINNSKPYTPAAPTPAPTKPAPSRPAPSAPDTAPSFDFYKVLPSKTPSELPPSAAPRAPAPSYYLQAGAFRNATDADNLKAQLAMLGIEAVIQTAPVADRGVFHRVRVGPFTAMDEINRTRTLLTQNDIPATLVKVTPTPKETP